jgi:hypothetical protein
VAALRYAAAMFSELAEVVSLDQNDLAKVIRQTRAAVSPAILPPISIARSLPVCPTLALTVFVMRVVSFSFERQRICDESLGAMGQNTRCTGLFLKCADKHSSLAGKTGNIFRSDVLSN